MVVILLALALASAFPSPSASPLPTRTVTLTPIEVASAYTQCTAKVPPPYAHPSGTVFVGGFTAINPQIGSGTVICPAYQGLVRFDLDGLDAASIVKATLFYEAKQNYKVDGTTFKGRATCVGAIGATAQSWSAESKPITPTLTEVESIRPLRGNFRSPPIDVTALLKGHLADVKANGLVLDGTVENLAAHVCLSALGHIELRLEITGESI